MRKFIQTIVFLSLSVFSFAGTNGYEIGDVAADFTLKNIDGSMVSMKDYKKAKGFIVVFTCNHCPYAKAYEERIIALQNKYGSEYQVIAINPNDAKSYPDDNFESMQVRAKEKGFNFPYLLDESQEIAKSYGATKTPHVYLLEKEKTVLVVKYIGAIDDNYKDANKVKKHYLENAITDLKEGNDPKVSKTLAIGCSVKWKK